MQVHAILSCLAPFLSYHLKPERDNKFGCHRNRTQVTSRVAYVFSMAATTLVNLLFIELMVYHSCKANLQSTNTYITWIDILNSNHKRKGRFLTEIAQQKILAGGKSWTCDLLKQPSDPNLLCFTAAPFMQDFCLKVFNRLITNSDIKQLNLVLDGPSLISELLSQVTASCTWASHPGQPWGATPSWTTTACRRSPAPSSPPSSSSSAAETSVPGTWCSRPRFISLASRKISLLRLSR